MTGRNGTDLVGRLGPNFATGLGLVLGGVTGELKTILPLAPQAPMPFKIRYDAIEHCWGRAEPGVVCLK